MTVTGAPAIEPMAIAMAAAERWVWEKLAEKGNRPSCKAYWLRLAEVAEAARPKDALEIQTCVARAIWERRRMFIKLKLGQELEEWGNGEIPRSNGIMNEAEAAIMVYDYLMRRNDPAWKGLDLER